VSAGVPGVAKAFLDANAAAYARLVERVRDAAGRGDPDATLRAVEQAASFAADYHPGRFADGTIENVALELGWRLDDLSPGPASGAPFANGRSGRRVLHVTTSVLGVGGHTRMLYHWIAADRDTHHSVLVTRQGRGDVPAWLTQAVRDSGGETYVLEPALAIIDRARHLRDVACRGADLVVLHHFASDVVPTVAFAAAAGPPVAVLNHADHQFWLGSSIADLVINLRTAGARHTADRRFVRRNTVMPIPLPDDAAAAPSRTEARRALGLDDDAIVLLSVGRPLKYRPCGAYDFVATANRVLERHPRAVLLVVGETAEGIRPHLREPLHPRLLFEGTVEDPSPHRAAADVYVESFPFGSQTALLEAAMAQLPVVPAYAPLFPLLVANDDALVPVLPNPPDEAAFRARIDELVTTPGLRASTGAELRERLLVDHVGDGWLERLRAVYEEVARLPHAPTTIPSTEPRHDSADLGLAQWNALGGGAGDGDATWAALAHTASISQLTGDAGRARWCALAAWLRAPARKASWRLLEGVWFGRGVRAVRQRLLARGRGE